MPIDRGVIDQQLQQLGESTRWWNQRELRDLPAVLDADEHILAISRGKIARVRWLRRPWLIVITDRRVLCVRSAHRTGWRQLEISADQITRVALRIGLFRGRVLIMAEGRTYRLLVPRLDAYKILTALSNLGAPRNDAMRFAPTRMVRRVMDHVFALPAAALNPELPRALPAPPNPIAIDERLHALEEELQELRQQIRFLEQLLRERHQTPNTSEVVRSN